MVDVPYFAELAATKVFESLDAQKRIFTKDWSLYDGQHVVFNPKLLSARELQTNTLLAYTKFYSLRRAFALLIHLHFRNAMFRLQFREQGKR